MLKKILSKSRAFDPSAQQFLSVDRESIESDLDLARHAEQAGRSNVPNADAEAKDSIAQEIDAALTACLRRGRDELQDHFRAIGAMDGVRSLDQSSTEMRKATLESLTDLYARCKGGVNELYSKKRLVADGERAYEKFRAENRLDRPAHSPENRARGLLVVVFILLIEALFNAWSLGSAHPEGPFGIFMETFLIAVVNVLCGTIIGQYCWREIRHIKTSRRLVFGYIASGTIIAFVLSFNLVVGHYRDALLSLQAQPVESAGIADFYERLANLYPSTIEKALSANFLAFDNLMSALLVFIGIAMATLAANKVFNLDDPYPNYGKISRDQDDRNADYADLSLELHEELREIGSGANKTISDTLASEVAAQKTKSEHEQAIRALESKYQSWVTELSAAGKALYAKYREINERHRTTPIPNAFSIAFSLPDDMSAPPRTSVMQSGQQDMNDLRALKNGCLKIVDEALNGYLGIYKTIGELAPEHIDDQRLKPYDAEVEETNRRIRSMAKTMGIADQAEQ